MTFSVSVRAKAPRSTRSTGRWKRLLATHPRLLRRLNVLVIFTWPISIAARQHASWDGKRKWICKRELRRQWISLENKKARISSINKKRGSCLSFYLWMKLIGANHGKRGGI